MFIKSHRLRSMLVRAQSRETLRSGDYLLYLKQLAKESGKTIEITIKANSKAEDYKSLNNIINQ